jgi:hypothetical protein
MLGCHKRMGDMVVSDYAISAEIFREIMTSLDLDWEDATTDAARDKLVEFANLLLFGYCCGLRGEEIVKVDIAGFLKYLEAGRLREDCPHVVVPLLGRLKGETGERYHMMILARKTDSGLDPGRWADNLEASLKRRSMTNGFIFQTKKGKQAKIGDYEEEFLDRLVQARISRPNLFAPDLNVVEVYSLRRSLRRGSTSAATNKRVPKEVIELNNRWRKFEAARGRRPGMSMVAHYTEISLAIPTLWMYSKAL